MYFTKGDTPAAPLLVVPARGSEPIDLELFDDVEATVVQPDGTRLDAPAEFTEDEEGRLVSVVLPLLDQAGRVLVELRLTGDSKQDTVTAPAIAVEDLDGWHTIGSARAEWTAAGGFDDWRLYVLLQTAKSRCIAYAPEWATKRPTVDALEAQLKQARNQSREGQAGPDGSDGVDGYGQSARPMDWAVKALLRPPTRFGAVR